MKVLLSLGLTFLLSLSLSAQKKKPLLKDFMGINGHYHFKPELYKENCRLVRNYHSMNWDVKKPGDKPTFPICANKVNWDTVYGKWIKHGFEIDLCAMFSGFGEGNKKYKELWKGKEKWAYKYGYEMAKHFGPTHGNGYVTSIEIGNEPGGDFDEALYKKIYLNMAKGIRAADPKLKIITCTAHARKPDDYSKDLNETFISSEFKGLYDVINLHTYASKPKKKGQSPWDRSYPEDPNIEYLKVVDEAIAWRNKHTPGKEVWITEFGWDACTPDVMKNRTGWFKKLNWTGQTDLQQAQYLVRSFFVFAERDVERAYLYFFNDDNKPSTHAASGLTRNFKPKKSYWAVSHLYKTLGDFRFSKIVKKSADSYVYEFIHANGKKKVWICWVPNEPKSAKAFKVTLPFTVGKVEQMPTKSSKGAKLKHSIKGKSVSFPISGSPVYIFSK